jgi:hypothetical protein
MQALEMAKAGATMDQVARALGYANRSGAWKAVQRMLKAARALRDDDAEIHRQMMIERLNTYRMGLYPKARNGDTRAVEVLLKVEDRQAALLGLDAPKRTELSGPEGGAIQIDQDVTYSPEIRQQRIIAIFDAARRRSDPALESGQSDMDSSGGGPDISLADAG